MRLIDADELKKPIYAEEDNITGSGMTYDEMDGYNEGIDATWGRIENAPTIDAEPVVHGHWKKEYKSGVKVKDGYVSSCCDMWNERKTRYCPNCGAKMDEVMNDENTKRKAD